VNDFGNQKTKIINKEESSHSGLLTNGDRASAPFPLNFFMLYNLEKNEKRIEKRYEIRKLV
jgi:hypothetical protein